MDSNAQKIYARLVETLKILNVTVTAEEDASYFPSGSFLFVLVPGVIFKKCFLKMFCLQLGPTPRQL